MLRPLVNCDSISDILGSAEGTARYVGGGTKGSSFFVSFPLFWSIGRGRAVAVAVDCYDHLLRFKFNLFFFVFVWLPLADGVSCAGGTRERKTLDEVEIFDGAATPAALVAFTFSETVRVP